MEKVTSEKLTKVGEAFQAFQKEHNVQIFAQIAYEANGTFPVLAVKDLDEPKTEEVEAEVVEG